MAIRSWPDWIPNGLTVAIVVLLAANYFSTFGDLDYTWQIRTGELILRTGKAQPPDEFSYTFSGSHLPDCQAMWEAGLWIVWDQFGYGGLKLLKTILVGSTLVLLAWRLRVAGLRWHGIALAVVLAIAVLAPAWNLRSLYCTTLGLLAVSGWLYDHCTGRKPLTWGLPVVMLLWGNCHAAVITGQALIVGAIAWEWANQRSKLNPPLTPAALRRLTVVGGLGLLASLVCPDPVERLIYPFSPELRHPIQRAFVEMQPLYTTVAKAPYTSGLIYVLAALVAVSVVLRFRHYRGWEIMLLCGLFLLANTAARAAQDCFLLMLALGLPQIVALLRKAALADRRPRWVALFLRVDSSWKRAWNSPLLRFQGRWLAVVAAVLVIISLIPPLGKEMPRQDADEWPAAGRCLPRAARHRWSLLRAA